jgi:hypothetical protein
MASDFSWTVNGVPFETAFGNLFLTDATVWRPPVTVRDVSIVIPGQHGALAPGLPVYEEPTVTLTLRSRQASQAALEEAVNQATAILAAPTLTLSRVSGALATSAVAKLKSISQDDFTYARTARITAQYRVPGVFFRTAVWTSSAIVFASALTNVEMAGLSGSTGPVVDAVVRVGGPCTNPYVTDPTTGTGISYTGTVAAGQYLYLSARPLSGRLSSSDSAWASGGTDVSGLVSFPAAGRLQLWPVVQTATTRKVLISASGSGMTAATTLAVRAQGSYL